MGDMLVLADAILRGGLLRRESRGSHFRTDFPERNDAEFLRTTRATFNRGSGEASIDYEPVEIGLVTPRARTYGRVESDEKTPQEQTV